MVLLRRPVRRSRAQVKCWATIPVPDSRPVITDLGWHTDFAQHYVKVGPRGGGTAGVAAALFQASVYSLRHVCQESADEISPVPAVCRAS
jgi:hypothetical protein